MPTQTDTARRLLRTTAEFWVSASELELENKYWATIGESLQECLDSSEDEIDVMRTFIWNSVQRMSKCTTEEIELSSFAVCWALSLMGEISIMEKEERQNG